MHIVHNGQTSGAVVIVDRVVTLRASDALGQAIPADLDTWRPRVWTRCATPVRRHSDVLRPLGVTLAGLALSAPIRRPPKIGCLGLNYREHASDLDERSTDERASFMRPAASIHGPNESICLPPRSQRVTGEAELAVVIGRRCRYISRDEACGRIAGVAPAIDMTAEDILRRNPRFLRRAKSFDTLLSPGPFIVTVDEVGDAEALRRVRVTTTLNGRSERTNTGTNMTHDVFDRIAFHSQGMTWEPGRSAVEGDSGSVVIRRGNVIGCDIDGIGHLQNPDRISSDRLLAEERAARAGEKS